MMLDRTLQFLLRLFSQLVATDEREPLVGDLLEEYAVRSRTTGAAKAFTWTLKQVCTSAPVLIRTRLTHGAWSATLGIALLAWLAVELWACAMPVPVEPKWQTIAGANRRLEMATIASGRPFVVGAFRMEPGCVIPTHCHPGGGGVTICSRGSLTLQHFELQEGSAPFSETGGYAVVSQVKVAYLREGEATSFTPTQANLHQLRAGSEGAVGFDIAVQWRGAGEFSFLKLNEDVPASKFRAQDHLKGRWTGMEIAKAYVG